MAFYHGVRSSEVATSLISPVQLDSGIIFAVGTAPVHLASKPAEVNKPKLCYNYNEYVEQFGYDGDFDAYTLDEVASSAFALFGVSPVIFVNVLDPAKHYESRELTAEGVNSTPVKIDSAVILDSLKIEVEGEEELVPLSENTEWRATEQVQPDTADNYYTVEISIGASLPSDKLQVEYNVGTDTTITNISANNLPYNLPVGATNISVSAIVQDIETLEKNIDYTAAYNSDGELVITMLNPVAADKIKISYKELDASKVKPADIIGGVDLVTNENKGLEIIEDCYPKFRMPVGIIIAPKYSQDVTVAAVMKAKCTDINSVFNAIAIVDIPTSEVKNYTEAAEYKNLKNLVDTSVVACWPKLSLGGVQYNMSSQLAALMNLTDYNNDGLPYVSPSNKNLQCDMTVLENGEERFLSLTQANYLNSQGIVTALNFSNGWVAWGNSSSIYPSSTDPKQYFISIRRFFYFLRNTLVLTYFQEVDNPITRRFLEKIQDSVNIYLNGLVARGALVGGRLELLTPENPTTDLMAGIVRFHLYITPPSPAQEIDFVLEYDPSYLESLFA